MDKNKTSTNEKKLSLPLTLFLVVFMLGTSLLSLYIYHKHSINSDRASQPISTAVTDEYGRININDATYSELLLVDGIGKEIANDILEFRATYGIITDMNVLSEIDGIGEAKLEALKRHFFCYEQPSDFTTTNTMPTEATTTTTTTTTTIITTTLPTHTSETTTSLSTTEHTKRPSSSTTTTVEKTRRPVNINTASANEISDCLLIDIAIAEEIVELRELISGYDNTLEILYCENVSDALYLELEDYLLLD